MDMPQGTLDLLILKILVLQPEHGYAIARRLQQVTRSVVEIKQGTLYPALHRLEKRGWLKAEWRASETGREAKYYRLTASGRRQLAQERAAWERLSGAVRMVLDEN
jgi:transcriptional regulator